MPKLYNTNDNPNIVKVEPNPYKKCSVKVKMEVLNVSGGKPKYTTLENGKKKFHTKTKEPKNMNRLPGTVVEYSAALGRNGLLTGLDEIVTNPYSELDYYKPGWEQILKGKPKVRRQELLEYKHGKERGFYTSQVSEIISSRDANNAPFYQRLESRVLLNDGVTYFDLNNPIHEANYHMMRKHPKIANSFEELTYNPDASHYIVDEKEKTARETNAVRKKNKVGFRLEEIMSLGDNTVLEFCKALNIRITGFDKNDAYQALDSFASKNDACYEEFMDVYDMWKDQTTREIFDGHVEVYDLLSIPGILVMRSNKIFWSQPASDGGKRNTWEWKSKDEFIRKFLIDPAYQEEAEILRSQYRSKTRFL